MPFLRKQESGHPHQYNLERVLDSDSLTGRRLYITVALQFRSQCRAEQNLLELVSFFPALGHSQDGLRSCPLEYD